MNKDLIKSEVIVFLLNNQNQVLLQKRSQFEKHNPNKWSICAGHVEEFDTSLENAVVREVKEELNIDILESSLISMMENKDDSMISSERILKLLRILNFKKV